MWACKNRSNWRSSDNWIVIANSYKWNITWLVNQKKPTNTKMITIRQNKDHNKVHSTGMSMEIAVNIIIRRNRHLPSIIDPIRRTMALSYIAFSHVWVVCICKCPVFIHWKKMSILAELKYFYHTSLFLWHFGVISKLSEPRIMWWS